MQICADPDPGQTLPSQKMDSDIRNILYVWYVICHKTYIRRYTSHFERLKI
jgi:hypothetical protein